MNATFDMTERQWTFDMFFSRLPSALPCLYVSSGDASRLLFAVLQIEDSLKSDECLTSDFYGEPNEYYLM